MTGDIHSLSNDTLFVKSNNKEITKEYFIKKIIGETGEEYTTYLRDLDPSSGIQLSSDGSKVILPKTPHINIGEIVLVKVTKKQGVVHHMHYPISLSLHAVDIEGNHTLIRYYPPHFKEGPTTLFSYGQIMSSLDTTSLFRGGRHLKKEDFLKVTIDEKIFSKTGIHNPENKYKEFDLNDSSVKLDYKVWMKREHNKSYILGYYFCYDMYAVLDNVFPKKQKTVYEMKDFKIHKIIDNIPDENRKKTNILEGVPTFTIFDLQASGAKLEIIVNP